MDERKQIEELTIAVIETGMLDTRSRCEVVAEELYRAGYRLNQVKRIFDEIDQALLSMKYNAKTARKTVKVEELKEQVDWVLHEVIPNRIAEIRNKYM